ncbi:MAG: esterase [Gammaproteobacteria bacterium]|nr:esterase [Gammaproteobacteria bacterium]|tara:strand:+ start:1443 stop:1874 length:432 start_codon:yes stop_codon:yes gene_type:complete
MTIWTRDTTLLQMAENAKNSAVTALGIEFTEIGDDFLRGRMPVDQRTVQPFGILHGGASVLFAETLGSVAANRCLRRDDQVAVGLDINANHIRPVSSGWVVGTARAVHIGGTTQVWEIRIETKAGKTVCVSRLTMAIIARPAS